MPTFGLTTNLSCKIVGWVYVVCALCCMVSCVCWLYRYTNWGSGEPNSNSSEDDCVTFLSDRGDWNDMPCSHIHTYMCKMISGEYLLYFLI